MPDGILEAKRDLTKTSHSSIDYFSCYFCVRNHKVLLQTQRITSCDCFAKGVPGEAQSLVHPHLSLESLLTSIERFGWMLYSRPRTLLAGIQHDIRACV